MFIQLYSCIQCFYFSNRAPFPAIHNIYKGDLYWTCVVTTCSHKQLPTLADKTLNFTNNIQTRPKVGRLLLSLLFSIEIIHDLAAKCRCRSLKFTDSLKECGECTTSVLQSCSSANSVQGSFSSWFFHPSQFRVSVNIRKYANSNGRSF